MQDAWASVAGIPARRKKVVFVGTERGMEARLVPEAGLPLETIRVGRPEGHGRHAASFATRAVLRAGDVGFRRDSAAASISPRPSASADMPPAR